MQVPFPFMEQRIAEYECVGGPFDGSLLPYYGREQIVKVLERSAWSYRYVLRVEDDGSRYFEFAGLLVNAAA